MPDPSDPGSLGAPAPAPRGADDLLGSALSDLRREIRRRFGAHDLPDPSPEPGVDWFQLFDELRARLATVGMGERSGEIDEFGMDEEAVRRAQPLLDFLCRRYWRAEVRGLDHLPAEGPVLFVANRAGLLPWDGLVIAHIVAGAHPRGERPRFMVADWLITLPFVQATLARLGGVRACRENAERLLRGGRSVVAFPEGAKGAAKVFRDRYRVRRFGRGGVIRLALQEGVPIVPVAVVGTEEVHPILFKVEAAARGLGMPFLPVTPTFPWLGPLGLVPLPSRWSLRFGAPLSTEGAGAEAASDELLVARLTEDLRGTIQEMLDDDVARRPSVFA